MDYNQVNGMRSWREIFLAGKNHDSMNANLLFSNCPLKSYLKTSMNSRPGASSILVLTEGPITDK